MAEGKLLLLSSRLPLLLCISAFLLRLFCILFGELQDARMEVRYTDIDYAVYSDAAALLWEGRSPFDRDTYRYSPLLALLLVPNALLHRCWGKFLFSAADLLVGHMIHRILRLRGVQEDKCAAYVAMWLFNPFTFTVATRGNCEAIACLMILWVLHCLLTGHVVEAAIWYGVVVHFRIYPIIYVMAILVVLDSEYPKTAVVGQRLSKKLGPHTQGQVCSKDKDGFWSATLRLLNRNRILFGIVSAAVFFILSGLSYACYGSKFLHESLLYHLTRTDPRHNFSIYFYYIYLHHGYKFTLLERLLSFLPQFLVQFMFTRFFAKDLQFCMFIQTVAFVAFNKVITAQYFVWFFSLLPLILPWTKLTFLWKGVMCIVLWTGAQLHWLAWAYALEFQGRSVFLQLWFASIAFFWATIIVLVIIIKHHSFCPFVEHCSASDALIHHTEKAD